MDFYLLMKISYVILYSAVGIIGMEIFTNYHITINQFVNSPDGENFPWWKWYIMRSVGFGLFAGGTGLAVIIIFQKGG